MPATKTATTTVTTVVMLPSQEVQVQQDLHYHTSKPIRDGFNKPIRDGFNHCCTMMLTVTVLTTIVWPVDAATQIAAQTHNHRVHAHQHVHQSLQLQRRATVPAVLSTPLHPPVPLPRPDAIQQNLTARVASPSPLDPCWLKALGLEPRHGCLCCTDCTAVAGATEVH